MAPIFDLCVDVTTIIHWKRAAVGIVRVEQQFCLWLLSQTECTPCYVVYDSLSHQFQRISADALRQHLQRIESYGRHSPADPLESPAPNMEYRLKQRALMLIRALPARWQPKAHALLQRARPLVLHGLQQARKLRAAWRRLQVQQTTPQATPVSREPWQLPLGSLYISMGLDWNYKDMAQLYRIKQERQLKVVLFCYDLIPLKFPQLCVSDVSRQFGHYFTDLAWCSDLILCISQASQSDLRTFLATVGAPQRATAVIKLGADILAAYDQASPPSPQIAALLQGRPFILFVSTIERRKNHETIYRAYARLAEEGLDLPPMLFVGMPGWGVAELLSDLKLDPRVQDRIHLLHHVGDADLAALYRGALFTVYPSLYEGWGLPVAESLAYGKYCLCANTSSLPEVGEQWVDYLDPWDLPAWVDKLRHLITHPEEVARRNATIQAGYRPYAWRQTAADLYHHARQLRQTPAT